MKRPVETKAGLISMEQNCDVRDVFSLSSSAPSYSYDVKNTRLVPVDCYNGLPCYAGTTLEFYLDPTHDWYQFSESLLLINYQVVKIDGSGEAHPLDPDDSNDAKIAVVSFLGQTIISRLTLEINNTQVLDDEFQSTYDLEAYWRVVLGMTETEIKNHLRQAFTNFSDSSYRARKAAAIAPNLTYSRFIHPFFMLKKAFPGHYRLKIKLATHGPRHLLIDTAETSTETTPSRDFGYDIRFDKVQILMSRITLEGPDLLRQQKRFRHQGYSYLFDSWKYGEFLVEPGSYHASKQIVTLSSLPKMIYIFIRKALWTGPDFRSDPYQTLEAGEVKSLFVQLTDSDGEYRLPMSLGYSYDSKSISKNLNYHLLTTQLPHLTRGVYFIDEKSWFKEFTFYPINLLSYPASLGCETLHGRRERTGSLTLDITFTNPIPKDEHVLISWFTERDCQLNISSQERVSVKYY